MKRLVGLKVLVIVVVVLLLLQIPAGIRDAEARLTASIYIFFMYYNQHLQFERMEFDPHFNQYIVSYHNNKGELVSFMLPKYFPLYVSHDTIQGQS